MSIREITVDSLSYPFSNWMRFLFLEIIVLISFSQYTVLYLVKTNFPILICLDIIGFLFIGPFVGGYIFKIINESLAGSKELPEFNNWNKMFIDGIKVLIVTIVYLIPVILIIISLYSGSDLRIILTRSDLNLELLLYLGFNYVIPLLIALLYLIMIIPVILMAIANMANNNSKLRAAFKFEEMFDNFPEPSEGNSIRYNGFYISIVRGILTLDDILELICSIGWDKLIIWYIATGIISLTLILVGFTITNITSILILHGLNLYSPLNYDILWILIFSLVLLPYLFIFLSRSIALIYNYAIKEYLIRENCMRNYQFDQNNLPNSNANEKQLKNSNSKKGKYIGLIVGLLVLVVLVYNFVNFNDNSINSMNSSLKTYSGNGISFNYPRDWKISLPNNIDTWNTFSVTVFRDDGPVLGVNMMPSNESTQDVINNWRNSTVPMVTIISNSTLKIDGNTAFQVTFINNDPNKNMRFEGITFVKNGKMYSFSIQDTDSDFDKEKQNFNLILNSFKVQ